MSYEAFPNAESVFHQAFASEDPAIRLLQLLNDHTTYPAVRDLISFYFDAVAKDTSLAQPLASALVTIGRSPDAPTYGRETLEVLLAKELAGTHFKYYDDDVHKDFGPTNAYLHDSLLSGLSLKLRLTAAADLYAAIIDGLEGWPRSIVDRLKGRRNCSEVMVVGSCIQLLLAGHAISTTSAGSYRRSPKKVAEKLKAQKKRGIVKDPHAIQVLDVMQFISCHRNWANAAHCCSSPFRMLKLVSVKKTAMTATRYGPFSFRSRGIRFEPFIRYPYFSSKLFVYTSCL